MAFGLAAAVAACSLSPSIAERGILPASSSLPAILAPQSLPPAARQLRPIELIGRGGEAVLPAVSIPPPLPVVTGTRRVRLSYRDVEIATVARDLVEDVLRLPLAIDPGVTGRMTLEAPGEVLVSQLPALFNQALGLQGYGLGMSGGVVRVAPRAVLDRLASEAREQLRVIPLRYVQPAEAIAAIRDNVPGDMRLAPNATNDGIVVSGSDAGQTMVRQLVGVFDVDGLRSRSFGLYPLAHSSPAAIVQSLTVMYDPRGRGQGTTRFIAVERLNAVLVVVDSAGLLPRVRQSIALLDNASEATAGVHVYPVLYRRATDLAQVLGQVFGGSQGAAPRAAAPPTLGGERGFSNSRPGSGGPSAPPLPGNAAAPQAPAALDIPAAGDVPAILTGSVSVGPAAAIGLASAVRIQADVGRNALVVLASPEDYRTIEQVIRRLDVKPRQVLIEAVIAEVRLNDAVRSGVELGLAFGGMRSAARGGAGVGSGGVSFGYSDGNITALIESLQQFSDVKVISAPRIMALDNETARIEVGEQVPILTRSSQSTSSADAPNISSIEMRDTGVILAVSPRIGADGHISLDIAQEVSSPTRTTVSGIDSPTIAIRRLSSSVSVQSGGTIVIGGLMQDRSTRRDSGVPYLSRIPVLGALFGGTDQSKERTELLVLLNPRIVDDDNTARELTDILRAKLDTLAPELGLRTVPPPRRSYVLPDRGVRPGPVR